MHSVPASEPRVLSTVARGPGGSAGFVETAWLPATRTFELRYACVDDLPVKIDGWGRESLEKSRGLPTVVYFSLKQLKRLGVPQGGLRVVRQPLVRDLLSLLQLHRLRRKHPGLPTVELARHTRSSHWLDAIARLSGHTARTLRVDEDRAVRREIGELLEYLERLAPDPDLRRALNDAALQRFDFRRCDVMLTDYGLEMGVHVPSRISVSVKSPPPAKTPPLIEIVSLQPEAQ